MARGLEAGYDVSVALSDAWLGECSGKRHCEGVLLWDGREHLE